MNPFDAEWMQLPGKMQNERTPEQNVPYSAGTGGRSHDPSHSVTPMPHALLQTLPDEGAGVPSQTGSGAAHLPTAMCIPVELAGHEHAHSSAPPATPLNTTTPGLPVCG